MTRTSLLLLFALLVGCASTPDRAGGDASSQRALVQDATDTVSEAPATPTPPPPPKLGDPVTLDVQVIYQQTKWCSGMAPREGWNRPNPYDGYLMVTPLGIDREEKPIRAAVSRGRIRARLPLARRYRFEMKGVQTVTRPYVPDRRLKLEFRGPTRCAWERACEEARRQDPKSNVGCSPPP